MDIIEARIAVFVYNYNMMRKEIRFYFSWYILHMTCIFTQQGIKYIKINSNLHYLNFNLETYNRDVYLTI